MKHLEQAQNGQNQFWKYLVLFIIAFLGANLIGGIPLLIVMGIKMAQSGDITPPENPMDLAAYGIDPNFGLFLMIIPFLFGLILFALLFKPFHKRKFKSVITGAKTMRWNRFFFAAIVWIALMAIYIFVDYQMDPQNFVVTSSYQSWYILILVAVLFIPFQTTFEEVLFRGYLPQGVASWTKSRWLALFLPSVLFGLMHAFNPEVKEFGFWITMPQYILFGVLFGLVSILDDGIELAMGAHAANNVFSAIFITNKASVLQTPAFLEQQTVDPKKDLIVLILAAILFLVIATFKYRWDFKLLNRKAIANKN